MNPLSFDVLVKYLSASASVSNSFNSTYPSRLPPNVWEKTFFDFISLKLCGFAFLYSRMFFSADMNSFCLSGWTTYVSTKNIVVLTPPSFSFCLCDLDF
jgi:hypothetical protein